MTDCHVIYKEGYIYPSNPSFPSGDVPADRDGLRVAEAILAASAVNRRGVDKIHEPLTALVAQGIGIDEIQAAWDRRQEDARKTVSSDRYMPNLAKWLAEEGPGGAWAMVAVERGRRRREAEGAPSPRPRMVELADGRGRVWGCVEATGAVVVLCDDDGAPIRADAEGSLDRARAKLAERVHERGMAG